MALAIFKTPQSKGSTLVAVLLVLLAITILGIMSISACIVELKIASNERETREIFYLSEGSAMEGLQRLADLPSVDLDEKIAFWHHSAKEEDTANSTFRDSQKWDVDGIGEDNAMQSKLSPNAFFAAVEHRLATGSSAIVTGSRLYMNQVYGLSTKYHTSDLVEIGYYLRY